MTTDDPDALLTQAKEKPGALTLAPKSQVPCVGVDSKANRVGEGAPKGADPESSLADVRQKPPREESLRRGSGYQRLGVQTPNAPQETSHERHHNLSSVESTPTEDAAIQRKLPLPPSIELTSKKGHIENEEEKSP